MIRQRQKKLDPESSVSRTTLELEEFLPYRLSLLTNLLSRAISRDYADRFSLTIPEWRIMAVLGRYPGLSATQVAERSAMDKVMVSRAVSSLLRQRRLIRQPDPIDRRCSHLRLSAEGRRIYRQIVPAALSHEAALVAELGSDEFQAFDALLRKLTKRAFTLSF